jgi:hypothetical protein
MLFELIAEASAESNLKSALLQVNGFNYSVFSLNSHKSSIRQLPQRGLRATQV